MSFAAPSGPYVFVSYAHADLPILRDELDHLRQHGIDLWFDERLTPGAPWHEELAGAIENATLFVLFLTARSVRSPNCLDEVHFALHRGKRILSVYVEDVSLPGGLELSLGRHQGIRRHAMATPDYRARLPIVVADLLATEPVDHPTRRGTAMARTVDALPDAASLSVADLCALGALRVAEPSAQGLAQAVDLYRQATERDPHSAPAHAGLALALCGVRYPFLFSWNPSGTRVPLYTWSAWDQQRIDPAARNHAATAVRLDPADANAHVAMATVLLHDNDTADAADAVEHAAAAAPFDATVAVLQAVVQARSDAPDAAFAAMEQALLRAPRAALVHLHAARLHDRYGNRVRASELTQRTLELAPDWSGAQLLGADFALKEGNPIAAIGYTDRAVDVEAGHPISVATRIGLWITLGAQSRAAPEIERLRDLGLSAENVEYFRLNLLTAGGDFTGVLARTDPWLAREPYAAVPLVFAAHALLMRGDSRQALEHLDALLRPYRDAAGQLQFETAIASATILHAVAAAHCGADPEPRTTFRRLLQGLAQFESAGNTTPELPYGRACLHAALGEYEVAATHLATAIERGQWRTWEIEQFVGFSELRTTAAYQAVMTLRDTRRADLVRTLESTAAQRHHHTIE